MPSKKSFRELPIRQIRTAEVNKDADHFSIEKISGPAVDGKLIIEAHRHDFYHIMYVKKGVGTNIIDFESYEVKNATVFFISPGQVHEIVLNADVDGYVISFDKSFFLLNENMDTLVHFPFFHTFRNDPVAYLNDDLDKIDFFFDEIYTEFQTEAVTSLAVVKALLDVVLLRISRSYVQDKKTEAPAYLTFQLRKLEALIEAHFKEYKQLADYAGLMHLSPKHLNSLVKKALGKSVTNLIHQRSLIEAKRLLLFTNNTITEIAFELGYSDSSYFMRFFKKHTNMTAEAYRKNKM